MTSKRRPTFRLHGLLIEGPCYSANIQAVSADSEMEQAQQLSLIQPQISDPLLHRQCSVTSYYKQNIGFLVAGLVALLLCWSAALSF